MNVSFADRVYLSGGLRMERGAVDGRIAQLAALPMVGGAWVATEGPVSLKLRAAYGKGIRWPQALALEEQSAWPNMPTLRTELGPEEQAGIEAGFDLHVGRTLKLQDTRFDQTATGLIQRVAMPAGVFSRVSGQGGGGHGIVYALQNVGEIGNRGWELQASAGRGPLSVAGTLSLVDSRVHRLAEGYSGYLEAGDRMLAVPARTASLTAGCKASRWSASLTASRAADWVNYDRIALARAYAGVGAGEEPVGPQLRSYWQDYAGSTHLRATFMRELRGGFAVLLSGDNLLNVQVGEPDNITVVPGRTISLGVRAGF
jgi:iron complex outermembrane receptor protein